MAIFTDYCTFTNVRVSTNNGTRSYKSISLHDDIWANTNRLINDSSLIYHRTIMNTIIEILRSFK